jgi:acyl-coenzyme A synthetase/AMP-(fatty) acid ligase
VGVADEKYGESVGAFVIVHKDVEPVAGEEGGQIRLESGAKAASMGKKQLTKAQVREWVRTRLSNHLVPKHVFWVEEYPKTASGKIQKFKLRDMAKELIGGGKS